MPPLPIGLDFSDEMQGLLPEVPLLNQYAVKTETNQVERLTLLTRPTLQALSEIGTGSIRGGARRAGAFSGNSLVVSGQELYRVGFGGTGTLIGTILHSDPVQVAIGDSLAQVATGLSRPYQTDGTTVALMAFPDSADVVSVGHINGYFLAARKNTKRIYYTDLLTGLYDAARFFAAERGPDAVDHIEVTSDEVWVFGEDTIEVFVPTGVDTSTQPPFQRVPGRLFERGCASRYTVAKADNTVFWLGDDLIVYRGAEAPLRISNDGVERRIAKADTDECRAWVFPWKGQTFYVLSLGAQGTLVYNIALNQWQEWASLGREKWRAHWGVSVGSGRIIAGDDESGQLWLLDDELAHDDGTEIDRRFLAGVPIIGGVQPCDSLDVACATGLTETGEAGQIAMRYSDDLGRTWEDAETLSLGEQGEYAQNVRWDRLGSMERPGRVFEWSVTDKVRTRFFGARINEPL